MVICSLKGKISRKNTFQYGIKIIEYNGASLWNILPVSIEESSSGSVFQFELNKNTYCLLIHRIIQNVPQNQFPALTYKLYTHFPFHIMSKLIRHYILALRCQHFSWGGHFVCIMGWWGALCRGSANQWLIEQLSVEFLIGEVLPWCALTSFVVDSVAIFKLARDSSAGLY